jgi:hypothetical protein
MFAGSGFRGSRFRGSGQQVQRSGFIFINAKLGNLGIEGLKDKINQIK